MAQTYAAKYLLKAAASAPRDLINSIVAQHRPIHPTVLIFHCTFVCDARCEMCSNWERGDRKSDMTLAEVETAVRCGLRTAILVFDNQRYGMIRSYQDRRPSNSAAATDLGPVDFAAAGLARAREQDTTRSFGMFSCSKASNEVNFLAQKFVRSVMGSNNIDSCNRT